MEIGQIIGIIFPALFQTVSRGFLDVVSRLDNNLKLNILVT